MRKTHKPSGLAFDLKVIDGPTAQKIKRLSIELPSSTTGTKGE